MIKDNIANAALYVGVSPLVKRALDFIREGGLASAAPGRYDIEGDNLYVMVQRNELKPWAERKWEAHRNYADIQYVISGRQIIGCENTALLNLDEGYDAERDVEFFKDGDGARLLMNQGDFAIFFPQDAHKPNTLAPSSESQDVLMAVFKVKL